MMLMMSASFAYADDSEPTTVTQSQEIDNAKKMLEQQRVELEAKRKKNQELLDSYSKSAKVCAEYIDALDEKIGYLNNELTILDSEIDVAQKNIDVLKPDIDKLNKELEALQDEYDKAKAEIDKLTSKFKTTYNAYCLRLRAMYVSGGTSIIAALLTCKDLAQFFSRYEMIKAISKSDTDLMTEIEKEIGVISEKQAELDIKTADLKEKKEELDSKQAIYDVEIETIASKQKEIATKKIELSESRAESDSLLGEYTKLTGDYTEFRNQDDERIKTVDKEIQDLLSGLKTPDELVTFDVDSYDHSSSSSGSSSQGALYLKSDAVLNLLYPVPGHYSVSQAFGNYRNGGSHTGIDYPCPTGSAVVAAQKGIVITVKRLNYSYGYYVMIYHGTDSKGRKIVTLYAHNSSLMVNIGQTVSKGQQIAKSGSTGNSTGPHCHFELIMDGAKVNPKNYLSK